MSHSAIDKLHVLMYLGSDYSIIREKKLVLMLINDKTGKEMFPIDKEVVIDNASIVFSNKDDFKRYYDAHTIYENFLLETDTIIKCQIVKQVYKLYNDIGEDKMLRYKSLPPWLRRYTPANFFIKIMESGIQVLKRDPSKAQYPLALSILSSLISQIAFRQHKKADWYAEKALILHRILHRYDEAAEVLLDGLKSDIPEENTDCLRQRVNQLANQKNIELSEDIRKALLNYTNKESILEKNFTSEHIYKLPLESQSQRGKIKFEIRIAGERKILDVEEYCIEHYISNGEFTDGRHWEGRIVTALFNLLFFDIIYTKPPGVNGIFLSYYQEYPLDMYTESFYQNRKTLIDDRLTTIKNFTEAQLLEFIENKWNAISECLQSRVCCGIGLSELRAACACAGARLCAALCARAARTGAARAGFPDLTLWNINTKQIKFVEVKSDSDKPSLKQLQWLRYLRESGAAAAFCYVGANTQRSRARAPPPEL